MSAKAVIGNSVELGLQLGSQQSFVWKASDLPLGTSSYCLNLKSGRCGLKSAQRRATTSDAQSPYGLELPLK